MHDAWKHKKCLHPSAAPNVCDAIVAAHSIQRSHVLGRITDSRKNVLTFFPLNEDNAGRIKVHSVGWKDASTFTGFCAKHDSATFKPIEQSSFSDTQQQRFLLGYRALCHEVYQKAGALKASPDIRRLVDRGLVTTAQLQVQEMFAILTAGQKKGLLDSQNLKAQMDRSLLQDSYEGWASAVINFEGDLCLSCTGAITPTKDLGGNPIQAMHHDKPLEYLLFGVAVRDGGGAAVFTWSDKQRAPRAFLESFLKNRKEVLANLIVQVMFTYIENTFFSARWWETLSETHQNHLAQLARNANPYYNPFKLTTSALVPWKITEISVY